MQNLIKLLVVVVVVVVVVVYLFSVLYVLCVSLLGGVLTASGLGQDKRGRRRGAANWPS